jgi:hypothetical protein
MGTQRRYSAQKAVPDGLVILLSVQKNYRVQFTVAFEGFGCAEILADWN